MSRQKQKKFSEVSKRQNVLEPGKDWYTKVKGKWSEFFGNDRPIVLELGCGRGEYTVGLARQFPDFNHIGLDVKGDRIWKGSGIAIEENLQNVAFIRTNVHFLLNFFAPGEVDTIWITFPDPRPRDRDEKHRLTFSKFMDMYRHILKPDGWVKFKTDNTALFDYTLELINSGQLSVQHLAFTHDLYHSPMHAEHYGIKTRYEQLFYEKGETIKYMKFQFRR